jgi:hypothetical protein
VRPIPQFLQVNEKRHRHYELQAQIPQARRPLPFRSPAQLHRTAVPAGAGLRARDNEAIRRPGAGTRGEASAKFSFSPKGTEVIESISRSIPKLNQYHDRPAADIAFCVAAYANGMSEDRIERAIEDDYLSHDPSPTKRAAYIRRTIDGPG